MSTFEILNTTIAAASNHYKIHDKWPSLCDQFHELSNNEGYFFSTCNEDLASEEKLNQQLQTLPVISAPNPKQRKDDIELTVLCLSGHIAKLEKRRSYLTIVLAMLGLSLAVFSKKTLSESAPFILLIAIFSLPLWLMIWNLDKKIFLLKRTTEHLKFLASRP